MTAVLEKSYWISNGKHQELSRKLRALVPSEGPAEPPVELYRCAANVYYDCYNNGGWNLNNMADQLETVLAFADRKKKFTGIASILRAHLAKLVRQETGFRDDDDYDDNSYLPDDDWMAPLELLMDAVIVETAKAVAGATNASH